MLKLRSLGINDYREGRQRVGRIRFVIERMPGVWLWNVTSPAASPWAPPRTGSAEGQTPPEVMAAVYKAMNIRDDPPDERPP
jgi:hypothetical protein